MSIHFDSLALPVPPGYRVGPWEVREPLASGPFATVYAGRRVSDRPGAPAEAALKFLPAGTRTPHQLHRLQELAEREPAILRRLQRPRLIHMYGTLTVDDPAEPLLDGATVLVLERADGSLDALLRRCPRPAAGPALLAQICEGLHQLHHAGWVHGDLTPGNVLLLSDHTVRLGDFSPAAESSAGAHGYPPAFQTTDYTAPELLCPEAGERGRTIRTAADVWAFGVLAHLVLTGTLPLPGATPGARGDAAVRYARGDGDALRLSPDLPGGWREIVRDCLAPAQETRAALDTAELLRRVESAAGVEPSPRLPRRVLGRRAPGRRPGARPAAGQRARPSGSGTGAAFVWGAAAAAVVAGVLMMAVLRGTPSADVLGYDRCAIGLVCFFSEPDGEGEMCAWYGDEQDWVSGRAVCEWGRKSAPKSVVNNGYADHLPDAGYYARSGFKEPLGCLRPTERRNLEGEVLIRSVKWLPDC
ncbi:serine/threonine protein kinase [Streptomyces jumonjinensis]|uniref:serine/threonine protein kinase n=1 Tax=Streptomyces jumonjinensis TaxID=1945 RepID=UPI0037BB380F